MRIFDEFLKFDIDQDNLPLRRAQIEARLAVYPTMVVPAMCIVPLLVWVMWDVVSHDVLLGWMVLAFTVQGFELWQWRRHRLAVQDLDQCRRWDRRFRFNTMLGASVWGLAWLLMYVPGNLAYQILIICLAMGFASGGMTINPVHRPSMFLYLIFLLLPLVVRLALENDKQHWFLTLMLLVFVGFMLNSALGLMRTFELSLRQRFEKEGLLHELREREEALAEALEKAEQANRTKSRFLAAASHDLRQPLHALRLFLEALYERVSAQEARQLVMQSRRSLDVLGAMFEDLMELSRLESGVITPTWRHFALEEMFDRLYEEFLPLARAKGLTLSFPPCRTLCPHYGPCSGIVKSDPLLLERILRNLVSNAIRYTDQGAVEVTCECLPKGEVEIAVRDSGIGIAPQALPRIFEEYYQVNNPQRDRNKGLGLGLAIVREAARLLNCHIEVDSKPGCGSTFRFRVAMGEAAQQVHPFVRTQDRSDLTGTVVALVEDDAEVRAATTALLEGWGCRVMAAESGAALLRALDLAALRPQLLLCDYRLPQQTALDVIRDLRASWGPLPAIVISGEAAIDKAVAASEALWLQKPVIPERLRASMHLLLQGQPVL